MISSFAGVFDCFGNAFGYLEEKPSLLNVHEAASRLRVLLYTPSPHIKELISCSKTDCLLADVLCRVFLEHVYNMKIEEISRLCVRKVTLELHPDKNLGREEEATKMFQLHQGFIDQVGLFKPESQNHAAWTYHKLWGWYYHWQLIQNNERPLGNA